MSSADWSFDVKGSLSGCSNVLIDEYFFVCGGNGVILFWGRISISPLWKYFNIIFKMKRQRHYFEKNVFLRELPSPGTVAQFSHLFTKEIPRWSRRL